MFAMHEYNGHQKVIQKISHTKKTLFQKVFNFLK